MSSGPLSDVKVLDLSRLLPGGFCTLLMADLGAAVLKVEDTGMGDYVRWAPPFHDGVEDSAKSGMYIGLNRGKRSIRLNLKEEGGRDALKRLAREYDVLLESFRPGVLDRLGVGYDVLREENPGLVYCAISGYGQDGPNRDRSGHDMNYLGLNGVLGLTGEAGGPPVQSGAQIADLGGGALMAAFGVMAALYERRSSGEGQFVDISMTDGSMSWLGMLAGKFFADGSVMKRGGNELAGSLICYRPYAASDGWVTLGALEPKFWQAWCEGVDREDLIEKQFESPGSDAHREVERIFASRTRDEWREFASSHDCCLEPVLDLDEALEFRADARTRDGRRDRPARRGEARARHRQPREAQPDPGRGRRSGAFAGRAHRRGAGRGRVFGRGDRGAEGIGSRRGPRGGRAGGLSRMSAEAEAQPVDLMRMSELAEASGVSAATIKHYLREGLLPEPVKTSRNMAYYPPEFVERIRLIKQLQEERYMPLKVIKELLDEDPERAHKLIELGDRLLEHARAGEERPGQRRRGAPPLRHPARRLSTASPSSMS